MGGVALTTADGTVSGRATQKRRLALLARLALAPDRTQSRDKLIGLFWAETDSERARHLLSVTLHELRRTLGDDLILSKGDDLTLNAALLTTDAEQFESALRQDQPELAVQLYGGLGVIRLDAHATAPQEITRGHFQHIACAIAPRVCLPQHLACSDVFQHHAHAVLM